MALPVALMVPIAVGVGRLFSHPAMPAVVPASRARLARFLLPTRSWATSSGISAASSPPLLVVVAWRPGFAGLWFSLLGPVWAVLIVTGALSHPSIWR